MALVIWRVGGVPDPGVGLGDQWPHRACPVFDGVDGIGELVEEDELMGDDPTRAVSSPERVPNAEGNPVAVTAPRGRRVSEWPEGAFVFG